MQKKKKFNWKKLIRYTTIMLIILAVAIITCSSLFMNGVVSLKELPTNQTALTNTYYILQIICAFIIVISAITAVWQYSMTSRAEREKFRVDATSRAVNMAEYYMDNILPNLKIIKYILGNSGILTIINTVPKDKMKEFDKEEYESLLNQANRDRIDKIKESNKFLNILLSANRIFDLGLAATDSTLKKLSDDEQNKIARKYMSVIVNQTLNKLEYFAMNFMEDIADEKVVYLSLHQTYIEFVQIYYTTIAKANSHTNETSKYFTNMIGLYNIWYNRENEMTEELTDTKRKMRRFKGR